MNIINENMLQVLIIQKVSGLL